MPHFLLEKACGTLRVCGVDEAGRGPWAGEVVAAAAYFPDEQAIPEGLNDSKKLSRAAREKLYERMLNARVIHGIGIASVEEIDALNIWGATQRAMVRAVEALTVAPEMALIDGHLHPTPFPCPTRAIIGGDGQSLSIAAASIVAKVTRDRLMDAHAKRYPEYGFERHAGYGTPTHREALERHGVCPIHRRSYAPIRAILERAITV